MKEPITIVPSPRIDWCGACKAEHGYDCPKDSIVQDWKGEFDKKYGTSETTDYWKGFAKDVKSFIEKVRNQALEEQKEKLINELSYLTRYYRSKFSQDCSREETEEEKNTEMLEENEVITKIEQL